MNFDFSDDQHDIKRTARDLLTKRSTWERVRSASEAGRYDDELWASSADSAGRGSRSARRTAARGSGSSSS